MSFVDTSQILCLTCTQLNELCPSCQEEADVRQAEMAHAIIDESDDYIIIGKRNITNGGSVIERQSLSLIRDLPSGHDWVSPEVVMYIDENGVKKIRSEFAPQTVDMADRIFNIEESINLSRYEHICPACHYVCHKEVACPNCN